MWRFCVLACVAVTTAGLPARSGETVLAVEGRFSMTPWVAADGALVAVAWGAFTPGGKTADVFAAVSRDAGVTFGPPVRVNEVEGEARLGGELPPRVSIGAATPGGGREIVVAYGTKSAATEIKVARSLDGGRTFEASPALQASGAPGDRGWHAMAVDASGRTHVMWLDHRGMAAQKAMNHEHHEAAAMDGVAMAQHSGLYYASLGNPSAFSDVSADRRSLGGSRSELPVRGAETEIAKGVCYCCKVAMATTTARGGALFAAWRHVYPGNIRDIAFTVSRSGGRSFSSPARVSEDGWQLAGCPDDGPAMSVDPAGTVHLVWPTVISGASPEGAIFYAATTDGKAFGPRQRVPTLGSPRPMHPQVLADSPGKHAIAWDEVLSGVRQAAVREVTIDAAGGATFAEPVRLGRPGRPSSYPMVVATSRGRIVVYVSGAVGDSMVLIQPLKP